VNNSGLNWIFVSGNGGSNPATAHGGNYNACLKDNNSADNKTRLITPLLNLEAITSPRLSFWHTQAEWYGTQDKLSVYYKTSLGSTWILLATYSASITVWTRETISLPVTPGSYYIAFEGNAKWGRGVCIDDVEVGIPVTMALQNINIADSRCFNASQTISVAGGESVFTVEEWGSATLVAGQNILFNPGTTVFPGGYLHGYIAPEGPYCTVPAMASAITGSQELTKVPEQSFFTLYPNPTSGTFILALNGYIPSEKTRITIYNMKGEKIISAVMADEMKHEFSLSGKPSGIYLVRVVGEKYAGTARVIKR
jgi:hypothetical protein